MKAKVKIWIEKGIAAWPIGVTLAYLVVLVVGMFGQDHGLLASWSLRKACAEMRESIAEMEAENVSLQKDWDKLTSDLRAIEKIARDELSMVRPNEVVFMFKDSPKN